MRNGGGAVDSGVLCHRGWRSANKLVDNYREPPTTYETGIVQWRMNSMRQNSNKSEMPRYVLPAEPGGCTPLEDG
jgi:hypothetical protein